MSLGTIEGTNGLLVGPSGHGPDMIGKIVIVGRGGGIGMIGELSKRGGFRKT